MNCKYLKLRMFLVPGVSYNTASLSATDFLRGFATLSNPLLVEIAAYYRDRSSPLRRKKNAPDAQEIPQLGSLPDRDIQT